MTRWDIWIVKPYWLGQLHKTVFSITATRVTKYLHTTIHQSVLVDSLIIAIEGISVVVPQCLSFTIMIRLLVLILHANGNVHIVSWLCSMLAVRMNWESAGDVYQLHGGTGNKWKHGMKKNPAQYLDHNHCRSTSTACSFTTLWGQSCSQAIQQSQCDIDKFFSHTAHDLFLEGPVQNNYP